MLTILIIILIFTVVVVVHELGHYWAAKRAGIRVEEFSIGMGPRIFHIKRGETIWSIKAFPIGGSCRMLGEDEEAEDDGEGGEKRSSPHPRSFGAKSVLWRMIVVVGGAVMNFALALILATIVVMFNSQIEPTVYTFLENSPAQEAGLLPGDRIVRAGDRRVRVRGDWTLAMLDADGAPMTVTVDRNGERLDFTMSPIYNEDESRWMFGFAFGIAVAPFADIPEGLEFGPGIRQMGFFESFAQGARDVAFYIRATITGIIRLFTHGFNLDYIMGPIGIVDTVGGQVSEVAETHGSGAAFWTAINFTVFLSMSLGIMNLLPLPALDGGRMVFLTLEAIRRKPIPPEKEGMVHFAGFMLLMVLAAIIAVNDISRFF